MIDSLDDDSVIKYTQWNKQRFNNPSSGFSALLPWKLEVGAGVYNFSYVWTLLSTPHSFAVLSCVLATLFTGPAVLCLLLEKLKRLKTHLSCLFKIEELGFWLGNRWTHFIFNRNLHWFVNRRRIVLLLNSSINNVQKERSPEKACGSSIEGRLTLIDWTPTTWQSL